MRALLTSYGSRGDVEPMVALGVQLRRLGADVRVCAPPDEEFTQLVEREDLPLVAFDRTWRSWQRPPSAPERQQRVADFITEQYDTVAEAAADCDVIVATAMSQFVGLSAAEKLGLAYRSAIFCPDVLDGLDGLSFNELFGRPINAHRASIGLPPTGDVAEFMFTTTPFLAADPTLGPWTGQAGFDVRQTGAWVLPDERSLPVELSKFLAAGDPPVYAGFGSMRTVDGDSARATIEGIRAQGHRVLVARGWAGLTAIDDQDDCIVVGEVNQQNLFERVVAVVHHGGAGTTTTAARAGVPQVVAPQAGDQPYWARRVAELGIGAAHDGPKPTVGSMSAALGSALTREVRARASAVAAEVRTDGARSAAQLLLAGA